MSLDMCLLKQTKARKLKKFVFKINDIANPKT